MLYSFVPTLFVLLLSSLRGNQITVVGIKHLAPAIKELTSLTSLEYVNHHLTLFPLLLLCHSLCDRTQPLTNAVLLCSNSLCFCTVLGASLRGQANDSQCVGQPRRKPIPLNATHPLNDTHHTDALSVANHVSCCNVREKGRICSD